MWDIVYQHTEWEVSVLPLSVLIVNFILLPWIIICGIKSFSTNFFNSQRQRTYSQIVNGVIERKGKVVFILFNYVYTTMHLLNSVFLV